MKRLVAYLKHPAWPKSCRECDEREEFNYLTEVDPCADGCIFNTFGAWALTWWEVFCYVARQGEDPKTKARYYEIDNQAVAVAFDAYRIRNKARGLRILRLIVAEMEATDYPEDWILGINDDAGDD